MKLTGAWLDRTETQQVCALLDSAGFTALLVGGSVRNALLGMKIADVDIATDALPPDLSPMLALRFADWLEAAQQAD